ncbi:uncharacterized protein LY89DRAFT_783348 [Mollisia scopiformis]|uniref:Uncharacterized protein n=1 Tax=Mollisia scopiformis TaxID=149040 RepID=A0A194X5R9_MOLSC|nr:uncharacterized protein LY89DRAFT_783348 [Mollisia scopiformis]KUJ15142.1 hypothetical protein LY89DRAFT_783348 [Mollisia scopiformis]
MRTKRASSTPTPVIDDDDDYDVPDILQRSSMMGTGSSSTGHASVDTGPAPSTRKTTKKVFEPSKEVLMIEMRLTTDEMENAVYLKEMFDVIKKRMKFENSKDSPEVIAADWHSVASHLFHSAHRTTKDQKYDRKTKRNWYLCEDEKTMRKHPNIKKKSCFFYVAKYVPTSQPRIQLFQGGTEVEGPVMKKDWDMSDRKARSDFVFSEGGTKKRGKAKAGQLPETLLQEEDGGTSRSVEGEGCTPLEQLRSCSAKLPEIIC